MNISQQIEAVYQRALLLRQQATAMPVQEDLIEETLKELYFVLEELQTADEELHRQNQLLIATRYKVEVEKQRYRTLFEFAPDAYLVTDLQGKIRRVNQAAATLLGQAKEYLKNKPLIVYIENDDRRQFQQRLTEPNLQQNWELTLKQQQAELTDSAPIIVEVATTALTESLSGETMILWSLRDITQRKQMEQQLQAAHDDLEQRVAVRTTELAEANARLQQEIDERNQIEQTVRDQAALIDIATDAIFVQDQQCRIVFWSQGAEKLYGWNADEILGQESSVLLSPKSAPTDSGASQDRDLNTLDNLSSQPGDNWQGEVNHQTKAGKPITVFSRQTQICNEAGDPEKILIVNTDITAKKQLEAQFFQAQRLESLGTVASSIAHDLNNILAPILVVPELLLNHLSGVDDTSRSLIETLALATQRGVVLSKQILAFAGQHPVEPTALNLTNLIQEVQQFLHHTVPKTIAIQVEIPKDLQMVFVDETLLHQVLINLCINARDAMPDGGTLIISAQNFQVNQANRQIHLNAHEGSYVVITIADTGIGIAPDLIDQIFDPFFTTKSAEQGTGLGLSTAAKIIKDCNGFICVSSQIGMGSQFQVYLPANQA